MHPLYILPVKCSVFADRLNVYYTQSQHVSVTPQQFYQFQQHSYYFKLSPLSSKYHN